MNRTQCLKAVCAGVLLILAGCAAPSGTLDRNRDMPAESPGWEKKMGGIVFFSTRRLMEMKEFYIDRVGCRLWLDQGDCLIFQHGNFLIGFCKGREADKAGIITFFYEEKDEVDRMYARFKSTVPSKPKMNEKFRIYHFFARDPEERTLEFQCFDHELPPY